jgi:hypothetical protein
VNAGWGLYIVAAFSYDQVLSSSPPHPTSAVKMQLVGVTLAALVGLTTAESLKRLDTSLTILNNNDLQGAYFIQIRRLKAMTNVTQEPRARMPTP